MLNKLYILIVFTACSSICLAQQGEKVFHAKHPNVILHSIVDTNATERVYLKNGVVVRESINQNKKENTANKNNKEPESKTVKKPEEEIKENTNPHK